MSCFKSKRTFYEFYTTVILNPFIYLFFVGEFLVLVPSHLPHLRKLRLESCHRVCDKYVEEIVAAVPELKVIKEY